jgi:hypothetical protein
MIKRVRYQALVGLALIVAVVIANPAILKGQQTAPAQDPAATAASQGGGALERITVTGYIVPKIGEGAQPVTTLGSHVYRATRRSDGVGSHPKATVE